MIAGSMGGISGMERGGMVLVAWKEEEKEKGRLLET